MAIAFVDSVAVIGTGASGAVNMSACNGAGGLFIAIIGGFSNQNAPSADTGSNTWVTTLTQKLGSGGGALKMFYVLAPSASGTHTFTNGSNSFSSMVVLGFSGVQAFDQESGTDGAVTQPGSITPSGSDYLFVTGWGGGTDGGAGTPAIDLSFTADKFNAYGAGVNYNMYGGYLVNTGSSAAKNPTWSGVVTPANGAVMATFSPAAGGGGRTTKNTRSAPLGMAIGMNWRSFGDCSSPMLKHRSGIYVPERFAA